MVDYVDRDLRTTCTAVAVDGKHQWKPERQTKMYRTLQKQSPGVTAEDVLISSMV